MQNLFYFLIFLFLFNCSDLDGQFLNENEKRTLYLTRTNQFDEEFPVLFSNEKVDSSIKLYYLANKGIFEDYFVKDSLVFLANKAIQSTTEKKRPFLELLLTDAMVYSSVNNDSIVLVKYRSILEKSLQNNNNDVACEVLKRLLEFLSRNGEERVVLRQLVNQYKKLAYDENELANASYYSLALKMISNDREGTKIKLNNEEFIKIIQIAEKFGNKVLQAKTHQLLGVKYWGFDQDNQLAIANYEKASKLYVQMNNSYSNSKALGILVNSAAIHLKNHDPNRALKSLEKAKKIELPSNLRKDYVLLYEYLSKAYISLNNPDSSLFYLTKRNQAELEANSLKHAKTVAELETKYQTAEKEKQILEEQQKVRANRNWLIAACLALIFGTGIAILFQKKHHQKTLACRTRSPTQTRTGR